MKQTIFGVVFTCVSAFGITVAQAEHPLWQDARISQELFDIAVADQVRKNCSSIDGRMLMGLQKANSLYKYAQSLGYTRKEVDAFVNSKTEQNVLRKRVRAYFTENDATNSKENGLCALGQKEIRAGSGAGKLLRG